MADSALTKALLAAQSDMPAVDRDGENPHFHSRFTTLGNLIAKARPVLNKHKIAFAQFPSSDEQGQPTLVTVLMHESGERLEYAAPLLLAKQDPQAQGSAITYMRRYALAAALGISDQDDDDGIGSSPAAASENGKPEEASPAQKRLITTLLNRAGVASETQRTLVEKIDQVPLTKAGASKILDLIADDDEGSLDERVTELFKVAGLSNSDVPADKSELPEPPFEPFETESLQKDEQPLPEDRPETQKV